MKPCGTQYGLSVAISVAAVALGLVTYHTLSDIRKALIEKLVVCPWDILRKTAADI